jgi:hypothetical protein
VQSECSFNQTEFGRRSCNYHVASQRQLKSSAHGNAVDTRDNRHGALVKGLEHSKWIEALFDGCALVLKQRKIGTRRKMPKVAAKDRATAGFDSVRKTRDQGC